MWLTRGLCKYVRVQGNRYLKLNNLATVHHCYSDQVNKIHSFVEYKILMFLGRNMIVLNIKKKQFSWPSFSVVGQQVNKNIEALLFS